MDSRPGAGTWSARQRYRISLVIHDFKPASSALPLHPQRTAIAVRDLLDAALRASQLRMDAPFIEKRMDHIQTVLPIRESRDAIVLAGPRQRHSKVRSQGDAAGITGLAKSNQVANNMRRHYRSPAVDLTA